MMSAKQRFFNPPPLSRELSRFEEAQQQGQYESALDEMKAGRKTSHWIWYIFPQLDGLGQSMMCRKYGIQGMDEAKRYLQNDILRQRLAEVSGVVLGQLENGRDVEVLMGWRIDALKLVSSMTLFHEASLELVEEGQGMEKEEEIFKKVLEKADGMGYPKCNRTTNMLLKEKYEKAKEEKKKKEAEGK